ncbi:hypothetical protein LOZ57_006285 [Ophidiomyces ophidiicola]|uniref:uncharacterized protein n=1 Tax=Ophidiomyces ophidiicola TaxID=1387563 RepID=UPI0020C4883F|nr:uncharacterized protein LOZ57_006285 [Ophidiomyces ophidiicola]KAI1938901.1 hypothetical protein LOZ57_006285 [Ophidiomyces ophidiicola]
MAAAAAASAASAATKAPRQKTLRLLDPTMLATSRAVRFPETSGKPIQGKARFANSRAAQNYREHERERLKKALLHLTHGRNIFVYNHLRTNQVVYSLSRTLERNNVLSQMIYHGKKTVPASLRKDMWVPFFSVHFPSPAAGIAAFKMLREFAVQRQLAPPAAAITNTTESLARRRPRDPLAARKWDATWTPRLGQFMPKKLRARALMDQKSTSVADLAAVLALHAPTLAQTHALPDPDLQRQLADRQKKKSLSHTARKRLVAARAREAAVEARVRQRIATLERALSRQANGKAAARVDDRGVLGAHAVEPGQVKVLWTDLHDAVHAADWPPFVMHGELAPVRDHVMGDTLKSEVPELGLQERQPEKKEEEEEEKEEKQEEAKGLDRLKFWKS